MISYFAVYIFSLFPANNLFLFPPPILFLETKNVDMQEINASTYLAMHYSIVFQNHVICPFTFNGDKSRFLGDIKDQKSLQMPIKTLLGNTK